MNLIANRQASIIIPTYNRASYLSFCLEALVELDTDSEELEIIIVDNNSTDNTKDVVFEFVDNYPNFPVRYVLETQQGLSYGRNRGITESSGKFLCFLDDDAPPFPEWLDAIISGFRDPTIGCIGGPALLDYQGQERPPWLQGDLQGLLSGYVLPYSEPTIVSRVAEFPFGCNLAFKKQVFTDVGLFRIDLGRSGNQVLATEDTEMVSRIHNAGWKVMYLPQARVRHLVAPERLEKEYIYRIGMGLAESHVILTADPRPHKIVRWFASDLWYASRLFFRFVVAVIRRKPLWFDEYIKFWIVAQRLPSRIQTIFDKQQIAPIGGG